MLVKALCFWALRLPHLSICLSVRLCREILLPRCLMNGLRNIDETYGEYSLAPTDDLIRFWMSRVEVTAGCQGGRDIHVDAGASKSSCFVVKNVLISVTLSQICCRATLCNLRGIQADGRMSQVSSLVFKARLVIFCGTSCCLLACYNRVMLMHLTGF